VSAPFEADAADEADEAKLRRELSRRLSRERFRHSEGVAALSGELCLRFGAPRRAGVVAGMAHDVARELTEPEWRDLASRDGEPFSPDEVDMPVLLHGRAGAILLRDELAVRSPVLLEAVRDHVTGRVGMGTLSSIVYVADYLEPGRAFLTEGERRAILGGGLTAMVLAVTRGIVGYLELRGRPVARAARELVRWAEMEEGADGSQAAHG
jgi:predicted HD superfamily hydrolase involved in NAD metabolism